MHTRLKPVGGPIATVLKRLAVAILAVAVLGGTAVGCGGAKRPVRTDAELKQLAMEDSLETAQILADSVSRLLKKAEKQYDEDPTQTLDFLALSGGGDWGAFGAGFLVGWGKVEDPAMRRPQFSAVTGVSTGALIAPFAFVGTDERLEFVENFYRNPKKDWIRKTSWLYFLPNFASFMTIPGLERDIRAAFNKDMIEAIAKRSEEGALLLVSATNLDLGRQKYWNIGAEAEAALKGATEDRVERMLMASTAIPVVFPPVEIDGELYGDGGVTANVLLKLEPNAPGGFIQRWKAENPGKPLPKVRYWIIYNGHQFAIPTTVQPRWPSIVGPSMSTAIRSGTLAEIRWLSAQAHFANSHYGTDIEVRLVAVPPDWRPPVPGSFQKQNMTSLADIGRKLGADPTSWQLLVQGTK